MTCARRSGSLAGLALACALAAAACRSTPKTTWDGAVVTRGALVADLPAVPPAWRRLAVEDAMLAFQPTEARQLVLVNGRCGLANDDVPLVSLTQQLLMGTTSRAILREERVSFDGREALRTFVVAKLDGVPRFYDMLVLKKNGCVVDFVRTGPPGDEHNGEAAFEALLASFHLRAPESP
jgi:hypothetical protein